MSPVDEYTIIPSPDTAELLRYHLAVTDRVDRANEIRQHEKALAALKNPPVQPIHQHATISHATQQWPENENNARAAKKHEQDVAAIAADDKNFKQLSEDEQERSRKAMQKQIADAANRKSEQSDASVGNGGGADKSPAVSVAPVVTAAAPSIPEWPPKG